MKSKQVWINGLLYLFLTQIKGIHSAQDNLIRNPDLRTFSNPAASIADTNTITATSNGEDGTIKNEFFNRGAPAPRLLKRSKRKASRRKRPRNRKNRNKLSAKTIKRDKKIQKELEKEQAEVEKLAMANEEKRDELLDKSDDVSISSDIEDEDVLNALTDVDNTDADLDAKLRAEIKLANDRLLYTNKGNKCWNADIAEPEYIISEWFAILDGKKYDLKKKSKFPLISEDESLIGHEYLNKKRKDKYLTNKYSSGWKYQRDWDDDHSTDHFRRIHITFQDLNDTFPDTREDDVENRILQLRHRTNNPSNYPSNLLPNQNLSPLRADYRENIIPGSAYKRTRRNNTRRYNVYNRRKRRRNNRLAPRYRNRRRNIVVNQDVLPISSGGLSADDPNDLNDLIDDDESVVTSGSYDVDSSSNFNEFPEEPVKLTSFRKFSEDEIENYGLSQGNSINYTDTTNDFTNPINAYASTRNTSGPTEKLEVVPSNSLGSATHINHRIGWDNYLGSDIIGDELVDEGGLPRDNRRSKNYKKKMNKGACKRKINNLKMKYERIISDLRRESSV